VERRPEAWRQTRSETATGLAIRFWLDREQRLRDRAMFDLAMDSKLRGCDVVKVKIGEIASGCRVRSRAIVIQQKAGRPVQFELLEAARGSILAWPERREGTLDDFVFPSRIDHADHISTRQYARLVDEWVTAIGLRREDYGTHSLRRTKASIIYKQTGNLRAVQILLGHTKIESTVATSALTSRTRLPSRRPRRCNGLLNSSAVASRSPDLAISPAALRPSRSFQTASPSLNADVRPIVAVHRPTSRTPCARMPRREQ
jgi:integrase